MVGGQGSINPATGAEEFGFFDWLSGGKKVQLDMTGIDKPLKTVRRYESVIDPITVPATRRVENLNPASIVNTNSPRASRNPYSSDPELLNRIGIRVPPEESLSDPFSHKRSGTYVYGGAGMINKPYVIDLVRKMKDAGIARVHEGKPDQWTWSDTIGSGAGTVADVAGVLKDRTNNRERRFNENDYRRGSGPDQQFNLVGYSYGGLVAAQSADEFTRRNGVVDNLVMLGTPISSEFLTKLKENPRIKNVVVKDLTNHGDPVHAGMSYSELPKAGAALFTQPMGTGHYYYGSDSTLGERRRYILAKDLARRGLR